MQDIEQRIQAIKDTIDALGHPESLKSIMEKAIRGLPASACECRACSHHYHLAFQVELPSIDENGQVELTLDIDSLDKFLAEAMDEWISDTVESLREITDKIRQSMPVSKTLN